MNTKPFFLGVALLSTVLLTACGNKDLSFDEARDAAMKNSHLLSDMLFTATTPGAQDFTLTTSITDGIETKIDLSLSAQSQQDRANSKSKTEIAFDADILTAGTSLTTSGTLTALLLPENLFLNIGKLWINSSDPNIAMVSALAQGVQGQWFKLPLEGETELLGGMNSYFSTLAELEKNNADLYKETGNQPYQGTFSQFNGKPAYQFTLDQEKVQAVIQEVVAAATAFTQQTLGVVEDTPLPDTQIPLFEGNFVLLGNDTIAIVVDTFEIVSNGVSLVGEYRYGADGMILHLREKESWQELISIDISKTKKDTYTVDIQVGTTLTIQGTASASIQKSALQLGFDLTMSIFIENQITTEEGEVIDENPVSIVLPLKGTRKYTPLKSVDITEPTEAVDLTEMLGSLLGMGGLDDSSYEDYAYTDEYAMGDEDDTNSLLSGSDALQY